MAAGRQPLSAQLARPPGLLAALRQVVRTEGVLSLWRGNGVTILHRLPYSSINFLTYERTSEWLARRMPSEQDVARRLLAGGAAGLVACTAVSGRTADWVERQHALCVCVFSRMSDRLRSCPSRHSQPASRLPSHP